MTTESLRRSLGALGIRPGRHTREGLADLFPAKYHALESGLGVDDLADVLVHFACRALIPLPPPGGGHVCRFYRDRPELLDLVVPYLRSGLEKGYHCVWIASGPVSPKEAEDALRAAVAGFDRRAAAGQIELLSAEEFYLLPDGRMRPIELLLGNVVEKARTARSRGFKGLRTSGDVSWAARSAEDFEAVLEYEGRVDAALRGGDDAALCTYSTESAAEKLGEVVVRHSGTA